MNYKKRDSQTLNRRIAKFVLLGQEKHGKTRYDYSLAKKEYTNNRTPVHLICTKCKKEPFLVYPFAHTDKGNNEKGTCPNCYVPKQTVQETRWNPNLSERITEFRLIMIQKHGEGRYNYPHLEKEYKNEGSRITVVCNKCDTEPYTRLARALKASNRYAGCEECNRIAMIKKIKEKNRKRQLYNHKTRHIPREYGCIYKITNTKNNKFYIGYSTMRAQKRYKAHVDESAKLKKYHYLGKSYLHNAMNHHGSQHFIVEVLEDFTNITPLFLADLERKYIRDMKPDYNLSAGGEIGRYKNNTKRSY